MFLRVLGIIFILYSFKCNCENLTGYYTENELRREGSGSDDVKNQKVDFRTWVSLQNDDEDNGSGEDDQGSSSGKPPVQTCEKMLDVAFILDASESIGPITFRSMKTYTKQIVNELDLTDCDNVGIVKFTDFANSETFFGNKKTKEEIFARIDDLEEPEKFVINEVNKSSIVLALLIAEEILFTDMLGLRNASDKFIVLMTDGKQPKHRSFKETKKVKNLVKKMSEKGIRVLVLAVGNNPSNEDLLTFTEEKNIFPERRMNDLMGIVVPKDSNPNAFNQMGTDFVIDEPKSEEKNNFAN